MSARLGLDSFLSLGYGAIMTKRLTTRIPYKTVGYLRYMGDIVKPDDIRDAEQDCDLPGWPPRTEILYDRTSGLAFTVFDRNEPIIWELSDILDEIGL